MARQPQSATAADPGYSEAQTMGAAVQKLRQHLDGRLTAERTKRYSFWIHWREIATYTRPRRYVWLATPNELSRGAPMNQNIIDPTGTKASNICSAGLYAGQASPARPWFKFQVPDFDAADGTPVKLWLDEVVKRVMRVLQNSNYYTSKHQQYADLSDFATSPMMINEDDADIIRCYVPCAGEYFVWSDARRAVGGMAREYVQTVTQLVQEFGADNVSDNVSRMFKQGGASLAQEIRVNHLIEPNEDEWAGRLLPSRFKWRETYWESGSVGNKVLRLRGYHEQPFSCPRWGLSGNDAYGTDCPGMNALGLIKQLQLEQRRKAQGIDKNVNPPLKAHVNMKNEPAVTIPGGVTYVTDMSAANSGIAPVYEVKIDLHDMMEDIQDVRQQIEDCYFVRVFKMLESMDKVQTAYEVAERKAEQMMELGPVIERNQRESLGPDLDRVFAIMNRRGLIPPAPPEIHGIALVVQYESILAQVQRAASTGAIEQVAGFVGRLNAVDPSAMDNIDIDEMIEEYADQMGVSAKVIRASDAVAQIRQQRAQAQQQQQMAQVTAAGVQGAQTLSQTPVGQGGTALDAMLGMGGGGGQQPGAPQ
ncbi:MAG TPA: portal protein [Acetobacteraceae bacterium]|jgi:hypothetical protein|nr:portal protein [Acetobacteraceae bacterium]